MWLVWHIRSVKHSVSFTQMLVNGLQLFICQQMLSVLVKIEVIGIHYQIDIVGWMWLVWHIRSVKHRY